MRARSHAAVFVSLALSWSMALAEMPITVGVRHGVPFATVQATGQVAGLYAELVDAIAGQANTHFQIEALPLPRLRQYLKSGSLTAVLAVPNPDMLGDAVAVGDVMDIDIIAVGRRGSTVHSLKELKGKKLCISRNSTLVPELYEDQRYLLREVSNHDSCPKMLDAGRVDFIVTIQVGLIHLLANMGKTLANYGEPYVIKRVAVKLLVAHPHAKPQLVDALRLALQKAKANGAIDMIRDRYQHTGLNAAVASPARRTLR